MTTQDLTKWMKYLPKSWKGVIATIMILGVPAAPFIKSTVDTYMDSRIILKTAAMVQVQDSLVKSQDSSYVVMDQQIKSNAKVLESVKELSTDVKNLKDWLIKNNQSNKRFGK